MKLKLTLFLLFSNLAIAQVVSEVRSGIAAEIKFSTSQISKILFKDVEKSVRKELRGEFENFNSKEKSILTEAMLERLIERSLLLNEAKKLNLMPSKDTVENLISAIDEKLEDSSSLDSELGKQGVGRGDFKKKLRQELAIKEFLDEKVFNEIVVLDAEIESEMNSDKHKSPEQFCLKLLQVDKKQDIAKIKKLAEQDFEATARKFSSAQTSVKKRGELSCYTQNQLPQEVIDKLDTLEVGVLSSEIASNDLFYLVELQKIMKSKLIPISRKRAEDLILRNKRQTELDAFLVELKSNAEIIRHDKKGA